MGSYTGRHWDHLATALRGTDLISRERPRYPLKLSLLDLLEEECVALGARPTEELVNLREEARKARPGPAIAAWRPVLLRH